MCSKGCKQDAALRDTKLEGHWFDQLDPCNRPDIVLDSVGKYFGGANQQLVARYREV